MIALREHLTFGKAGIVTEAGDDGKPTLHVCYGHYVTDITLWTWCYGNYIAYIMSEWLLLL